MASSNINMKTPIIIILISFFSSCNGDKDHRTITPDKLSINIGFYPSFHLPVQLRLHKNGDTGYLTCKVLARDASYKVVSFDSVLLNKNDLDTFFRILDTISLLKIPYDTLDIGNDGITIYVDIIQDGQTNKFWSWSPSRKNQPTQYKFLDAVFDLINKKLPKEENYIEDVQDYLSYGLGIKIKGENPMIIKMYGDYSIDDANELQLFFDSLPRDKPIIMNMSNFGGMGSILDDYFTVCDRKHEKMIWVTPGNLRNYFAQVGIDTNKMAPDIESAKKMAIQ